MAEDTKTPNPQEPEEQEFLAPDPSKNPRNQAIAEIAKSVAAQHEVEFAEKMPSVDEEGNITEVEAPAPAEEPAPAEPAPAEEQPAAPAAAPAGEEPIDPTKTYKLIVEGKEVEFLGAKIIEAGRRTIQKETAADYKLQLASDLLRDAEARAKAAIPPRDVAPTPAPSAKPAEPSDADLAQALQFGTPEQAAAALAALRSRTPAITPEQVQGLVAEQSRRAVEDALQFDKASTFIQTEYADLLANPYFQRLFATEEARRRAPRERGGEGDQRPYIELYKAIGEDLRKAFNIPKQQALAPTSPPTKPAGTAEARQERKAATPPVPKTAAALLSEVEGQSKVKTPAEIIAAMAAKRGQNSLTPSRKE